MMTASVTGSARGNPILDSIPNVGGLMVLSPNYTLISGVFLEF